jgi:hypothetical protein
MQLRFAAPLDASAFAPPLDAIAFAPPLDVGAFAMQQMIPHREIVDETMTGVRFAAVLKRIDTGGAVRQVLGAAERYFNDR